MKTMNLSRRTFLKSTAVVGGGLVVGISLPGKSRANLPFDVEKDVYAPNAFLQIMPDNKFVFYCPRDEMGQGTTTGLTTLMAEELDVSPQRFDVRFSPVHEAYINPLLLSSQSTGGSTSTAAHFLPLRESAARVRSVLVDAATADLGVARSAIQTDDAHIVVKGIRHPYGRFVKTAQSLPLPEKVSLKTKENFKYIGTDFPRVDAIQKSTGTAMYGIDVEIPNSYYALVSRCPVAGGRVESFDGAAARAMAGVTDVVSISTGVAVVAKSFWQAKKAVEKLDIKWDTPKGLSQMDSKKIKDRYQRLLDSDEGIVSEELGEVENGLANTAHSIESQYWAPYLAHATMEPMNATIHIQDDGVGIWTGTQSPAQASAIVARKLGISENNVRVHNTYMGGGFGRRAGMASHIHEAVEVAVQTGKPIKLVWTREDDIRHSAYRPAALMSIKAGLDKAGHITGWRAKRVGGNAAGESFTSIAGGLLSSRLPQPVVNFAGYLVHKVMTNWMTDPSSKEGLFEDYDFPNRAVVHASVDDGLPLAFWRSVGHSFTAFAKESAIDELAHAGGYDAVQLRLKNAKNNPRLQGVIKAVGDRMSEMGRTPGRFVGMAAHGSFGSYVAEAAEVSVRNGQIRVHKVLCVVDCGQVVNPDIVRTQMEGGIMFGLTAALYGKLDVKDGVIQQSNFHDYPILRINEAPDVEVVLIDSNEHPTGVGEPGLPPIAPAVANAVFLATGQRLRSLPLKLS